MGKFDGVMLVSDYDDTFYNKKGVVSKENLEAVEYLMAEGGYFTLATGRAHTAMTPQVIKHNLRFNAPAVLANGAQVYDYKAGAFLRQSYLRPEIVEDLQAVLDSDPSLGMEAFHADDVYIGRHNLFTDRHVERMGTTFSVLPLRDIPQPWFKAMFMQDRAALNRARDLILSRWGDVYEVVFSAWFLLEVTMKGCTKGGTILWLAERLGVSREHLYCIGDNQNDIPMLAVAALAFAPENCVPEVRDWGPRIVRHCDDHAVAAVVEILDKLY